MHALTATHPSSYNSKLTIIINNFIIAPRTTLTWVLRVLVVSWKSTSGGFNVNFPANIDEATTCILFCE